MMNIVSNNGFNKKISIPFHKKLVISCQRIILNFYKNIMVAILKIVTALIIIAANINLF